MVTRSKWFPKGNRLPFGNSITGNVRCGKCEKRDFEAEGITALGCTLALEPVRDALYVLNGKWKLPIIIAMVQGNRRFGDIRRAVDKIAAKVLSHELKELELNGFLVRKSP